MNSDKDKSQEKPWWQEGVVFFYEITAWIVGPIIGGIFLGKYIDTKYQTEPKFFFICVAIAFAITNIGLITETLRYNKRLKEISKQQHEPRDK